MIDERYLLPHEKPWEIDPKAEPRVDSPFASDRGLQPKRFILPLFVIGAWSRVRSWIRG